MKLEIVTPTHVGSGSAYMEIDYVYRNGKVRIVDYEKAYIQDKRVQKAIDNGKFNPNIALNYYKYEIDAFCRPTGRILEHIKLGVKPYIPGSSIKGAIRTAILWKYLKDNNKKVRNLKELKKAENEIFGSTPYNDIMKFLIVCDSQPVSLSNLAVYRSEVLSETTENGKLTMQPKSFRIYTESLKPNTVLEWNIKVKDGGKNNKYIKKWDKSIIEFSKEVIRIEENFFKERNAKGQFNALLKHIDKIKSKLESGEVFMRIGFSTGWLWKTVGALLDNKERVHAAEKLKINRGKRGKDFPKTRRVIVENKKYTMLPGWVKISYD